MLNGMPWLHKCRTCKGGVVQQPSKTGEVYAMTNGKPWWLENRKEKKKTMFRGKIEPLDVVTKDHRERTQDLCVVTSVVCMCVMVYCVLAFAVWTDTKFLTWRQKVELLMLESIVGCCGLFGRVGTPRKV